MARLLRLLPLTQFMVSSRTQCQSQILLILGVVGYGLLVSGKVSGVGNTKWSVFERQATLTPSLPSSLLYSGNKTNAHTQQQARQVMLLAYMCGIALECRPHVHVPHCQVWGAGRDIKFMRDDRAVTPSAYQLAANPAGSTTVAFIRPF